MSVTNERSELKGGGSIRLMPVEGPLKPGVRGRMEGWKDGRMGAARLETGG
jgi:hypothetical protein